jgi:hypothetical protein
MAAGQQVDPLSTMGATAPARNPANGEEDERVRA